MLSFKNQFIFFSILFLFSCKKKEDPAPAPTINNELNAVQSYAKMVLVSYDDVIMQVKALDKAITDFSVFTDATNFQKCKDAWLAARIPYGQTEAYRLYGGPIDGENGPEGLINAWPLDESFIDYVESDSTTGIINQVVLFPNINEELLISMNEKDSETNIATGFHAIEFLLWGQDLYEDAAGKRPYTDYLITQSKNAKRRMDYLKVCSALLIKNLEYVRAQWLEGTEWHKTFVNEANTKVSLKMIFDGIGKLSKGELAGERMIVAVENKSQEDEHSCFSDNTIQDIKMNFLGIKNVYLNKYLSSNGVSTSGYSLSDLVKSKNADKDKKVLDAMIKCEQAINLIPAPFDQAIIKEESKVVDAASELKKLSDLLVDAGFALGIQINNDLD
jgi:putative iron-regulated protein